LSDSPYAPPEDVRDARPGAIIWFRRYAAAMAVLVLAMLVLEVAAGLASATLVVLTAPLVVLFGVAAFVPYKPWGWTLGLVAIALGLAGITIVFALPLLLQWFKPTVKAAFARL
jgi:hypothetical protein